MKALVYRGPGKKELEEMPKPKLLDSTDAVVRMGLRPHSKSIVARFMLYL
jgi:hypothetical protein